MEAVYEDYAKTKSTSNVMFKMFYKDLKRIHDNFQENGKLSDDHSSVDFFAFDADGRNNAGEDKALIASSLQSILSPETVVPYKPSSKYGVKYDENPALNDINPGEELLFVFDIYCPFKYICGVPHYRRQLHSTVVMLGTQTLNQLCDMIICPEMYQELFSEQSENPTSPRGVTLGEAFKSRMLYMGNTFYIDTSFEGYKDYSKPIKEWAKNTQANKIEFGETVSMHQSTCLDLVARLKFPYCFQHVGSCEHNVCIKQVRLVTSRDCLQKKMYPFYSFMSEAYKAKTCMICSQDIAMWVVYNEPRLPIVPTYFCSKCFMSFEYVDGKKVCNFKAIRLWGIPSTSRFTSAKRKNTNEEASCDMDIEEEGAGTSHNYEGGAGPSHSYEEEGAGTSHNYEEEEKNQNKKE